MITHHTVIITGPGTLNRDSRRGRGVNSGGHGLSNRDGHRRSRADLGQFNKLAGETPSFPSESFVETLLKKE